MLVALAGTACAGGPRPVGTAQAAHSTPASALAAWIPGATAPALTATPGAPRPPRRWWHFRVQTGDAAGTINERWVGYSASDPTYFSVGGSLRPADPADWGAHRFMVEGRAFTFAELQQLPTDTSGVSAFLAEPYHTTAFTARIFGEAVELALAPTSPATLAAAYRSIAQRPEVHYAGNMVDPAGRRGIVLVFEFGKVQNQLIVDPRTGAALANRAVSLADGSVQLATLVLASNWTDSVPGA